MVVAVAMTEVAAAAYGGDKCRWAGGSCCCLQLEKVVLLGGGGGVEMWRLWGTSEHCCPMMPCLMQRQHGGSTGVISATPASCAPILVEGAKFKI